MEQPQVIVVYKTYTESAKRGQAKYRAANRDKYNEYMREWFKRMPEEKRAQLRAKKAERERRYRAQKKAANDGLNTNSVAT